MNLLQRLYSNAGLPVDFNAAHPVVKRERIRAANAWWHAEITQMYRTLFETNIGAPCASTRGAEHSNTIDIDADIPQ